MAAQHTITTAAPFATTHWSVVLAASQGGSPDAQMALERLCRTHWYPLYAFVRRQGRNPEEEPDLTQGFFERLLEKDYVRIANPARVATPATWRLENPTSDRKSRIARLSH